MKRMKKTLVGFLLVMFTLLPFRAYSQVDTFVPGVVDTEIINNEGTSPNLPYQPFGMNAPGGNFIGLPGGGEAVDVEDSVINALLGALWGTYASPNLGGSFDTVGITQIFSGNPAYVRKYGSVKSGVFLENGDFTWNVGAGLHLFGKIKNEDQLNRDFDFSLRDNEHFRMDFSYGALVNRQIWHSGDYSDYMVDARNWFNGAAPAIGPGDMPCPVMGMEMGAQADACLTDAELGETGQAPTLSTNGANPDLGFYQLYHMNMAMGQMMTMMNPMTGMMVNLPDYLMFGMGASMSTVPESMNMKENMEAMMRYTPLTDNDYHLETEFRPVDGLRAILGLQGSTEGGQDVQHILTFVFPDAPNVMEEQILPLPGPTGGFMNTSMDMGDNMPMGMMGMYNGGVLSKLQWNLRQVVMVRDPVSNHTTDLEGGADFSFAPLELMWVHSTSDFSNHQIIDPYLFDLLNRPFGFDMMGTLMTGSAQGELWNSMCEPGMMGMFATTCAASPVQLLYGADAGYLIPDYRVEDNHWNGDHARLEIPLGTDSGDALQFKFSHFDNFSDANFYNVANLNGTFLGPMGFMSGFPVAGTDFLGNPILSDPSAAGVPGGMFQQFDSTRDTLQLPTFNRPETHLSSFNFYAPLNFGAWHAVPNLDYVGYTSSSGIRSMPSYNYLRGGFELEHFGLRHSISLDFSVENESQSAIYDTRNVNTWDAANPIMNGNLQPGWLAFLQQIAFLYQNPGAPIPTTIGMGSTGGMSAGLTSCAGGDALGLDLGAGLCPGPQGSLGNINNILANNPTQALGLMTTNSFKWDVRIHYSQRLANTLDLRLNAKMMHDSQPYFRTDPNDENQESGELTWRPFGNFFSTIEYTNQHSRNDFLFPESNLQRRGSVNADWQVSPKLNLTGGMYREDQGITMQSPITGTSIPNGVANPILWWMVNAGVPEAYIQNFLTTNPGISSITPAWAAMYFLPDQNALNWNYLNQNSTYNFGFHFAASPTVNFFGNWSHSALTGSFEGNQKIPNPLELPVGIQADELLWSFNTPPNLNIVMNDVSLGFNERMGKDTTLSFLAGYLEYQDLNARLSRFSSGFATGLTPPGGGVYATSFASFGFPVYPTMLSPDSGKVLYFNVGWTRHF